MPASGSCRAITERQRAAAGDHREPARLAEAWRARSSRAARAPARTSQACSGIDRPGAGGPRGHSGVERVVHRHILGDRHDRADTGGGAGRDGVAHAFGRGVEHRHGSAARKKIKQTRSKKRQSVHGLATTAERDAADQRRAGDDRPRHLVAGVAAGRIDHLPRAMARGRETAGARRRGPAC